MLTVRVLGFHAGQQLQGDVLDVEVGLAAAQANFSRQGSAGQRGSGGEDRVHGRAADTHRAEQSLEHHWVVLSFVLRVSGEMNVLP